MTTNKRERDKKMLNTDKTIPVPYADEIDVNEAKKLGLVYNNGNWHTTLENIAKNVDVLKLMPTEQVRDLLS